jgi:tRNA(Ile)-lysidine synthetase-like protein
MGEGLSKKLLEGGQVLISKPKSMSQKLRIHDKQPSRDLKYLFQKHKVPTWERLSYPCIYIDNSLAAVIGIGINPEVQAKRNEMGYVITYKKPQ